MLNIEVCTLSFDIGYSVFDIFGLVPLSPILVKGSLILINHL